MLCNVGMEYKMKKKKNNQQKNQAVSKEEIKAAEVKSGLEEK